MAAHREAERGRDKSLGLLLNRPARSPPPGTMDKGPVGRVHQPNDRMVDCCGEFDAFDEIGRASVETVEQRDFRSPSRLVAKEHPNVSLQLAYRIAAGADTPGRKRL